jgi:hypothetical protein
MLPARVHGWRLLALLALGGCSSSPTRVKPPAIDPRQAAQQALAEYDTNGNGFIDGDELKKSPALMSALKDIDKNGDGKISAEEITQRIEAWQASKLGIKVLQCKVLLDGAPLAGATVNLVPEKFLGPNVLPATGTTNEQGFVNLSIAASDPSPAKRGVHIGLYRIEISKQSNGKEMLPAKYNVNSELGQEVAQGVEALNSIPTYKLLSH